MGFKSNILKDVVKLSIHLSCHPSSPAKRYYVIPHPLAAAAISFFKSGSSSSDRNTTTSLKVVTAAVTVTQQLL
jgi:hypothetical protein